MRVVIGVFAFFLAALANAQTESAACGGTSQPRCQIAAPLDEETQSVSEGQQDAIDAANYNSKLYMNVASNKFSWSFIPNIPTAACVNPLIERPLRNGLVQVEICGLFNTFQAFINGVFAFFCLLGCVRQVQWALAGG